jgi:hypothetical protein
MKLYVNIFKLGRFLTLHSESEYLRRVLVHQDGNVYFIETDDTTEIRRLLDSRKIKYTIK